MLKHSSECAVIADIICTCAANYKACQPVLLQHLDDLMREEKLADFVAETLNLASEMYDIRDFVQSALKNIGSKCYSDKVESGLQDPKACAKFLIKYSELNPKEIFRNMVSLNELIDSQSHTIRAAMVEVLGNIIHGHLVSDNSPVAAKNVEIFYETLHSRFLDAHHLVRARVLKVIAKRCQRYEDTPEKSDIPLKTRSQLVDSALLRLRDKNSMVRKKAIELMVQFLESNPFISIPEDQGTLSVTKFDKQINSLLEIVNVLDTY